MVSTRAGLVEPRDRLSAHVAGFGDVQQCCDSRDAWVLYGHLDEYHPPWGSGLDRQMRDDGLAIVRHHENASAWMSDGASMSRDDLVEYAIARLARTAVS